MKNHKSKILMLFSAMFLISILFALSSNAKLGQSIDCNVTIPTMQVGTEGNVTYNVSQLDVPTVSAAVFFRSSSTANSTDSLLINTTNSSNRNHVNFTITRGLNIIEDSSDYAVYAICYINGTATGGALDNLGNSSEITSRIIDFTAPTIPTSIVPTGTQSNNTLDFVSTVNGVNTTSCILQFIGSVPNGATRTNTMTHSGNLCTARYTSVSDLTYQYRITASDGRNTTIETASQYISVGADNPNLQGLGALKQVEVEVGQQQKKSSNNLVFLLIAVVVIAYMASKKKGR